MAEIKANELEFQSLVVSWLNEALRRPAGRYPFEMVSANPSVKTAKDQTRFPDVEIWLNRQAGQGFCDIELKTPATPVDDPELLENAAEKSRAMGAEYFVTWNMREAVLWQTPPAGRPVDRSYRRATYPSLVSIQEPDDIHGEDKKRLLRDRAAAILEDLAQLHKKGHAHLLDMDATFFVGLLTEAARQLSPHFQQSLLSSLGKIKGLQVELYAWAVRQAIANYDDPAFYDLVSRQMVYRLLGKIMFYETLRRFRRDLPPLELKSQTDMSHRLREYFALALAIDYQAVFEEDLPDRVPIPAAAEEILTRLVDDLEQYNFSAMPQEVVGTVFEQLIPQEERHKFGQYFTREELVDLINAFCIRTARDSVLDPTCGSGTFLLRAYDRLQDLGDHDHQRLLPRLWGIDIARFPAELATISLYRLNLTDYHNFPRIVATDFFEVRPGQTFGFPPPKPTGDKTYKLQEPLPAFDAAVGNFPYIRQELIEKRIPGYKAKLQKVLFDEWKDDYPELFKNGETRISGQADIYVYLFFHTARFLKPDGRMGFVTSNAWLDVAYGHELQKFLLKHFKVIAILESRCEPWFEAPAINTIVTILERCTDKTERDNHLVKFVKVKQKLKELVPHDMKLEGYLRWQSLAGLTSEIENLGSEYIKTTSQGITCHLNGHRTYETSRYRCRVVRQGWLEEEVEKAKRTVKWGQYLRAPEIFFEIKKKHSFALVPLNRVADVRSGIRTGINEFFYPPPEQIKHWKIEREFIKLILKSPQEFPGISLDPNALETKAFVCRKTKAELRRAGKMGALKYIEWGEKQVTKQGIPWPQVPSVQNRTPGWWALPDPEPARVFWSKAHDVKYLHRYSERPILCDCRIYFLHPLNGIDPKLLAAALNSSLSSLFMEMIGRVSLGEGALDIMVEDAQEYMLIPNLFEKNCKKLLRAFDKLLKRPIQAIAEETKMKDRQAFDRAVLEAVGIDPQKFLQPIYAALIELSSERINLAKLRKKLRNNKFQRDVERLKEFVRNEVLPEGPRPFPESFLESRYLKDREEIGTAGPGLKLGRFFLGRQEVLHQTNRDYRYEARSVEEAKYIIYAQKPDAYIVPVPKDPIALAQAVQNYEIYLRELREQIFQAFSTRALDYKLAGQLTQELWVEFGLPDLPK